MIEFSYIITYRESSEYRKKNLNIVLKWMKTFENIEIILVEQDSCKKIDKLLKNCKYVFAFNDGLFNRSWGLNIGALYSCSDILVFSDADILIENECLIKSVRLCREKYFVINPMKKIWDLPENFDEKDIFNSKWKLIEGTNLCGGMVIFRKDKFLEIKGWDEEIRGWGGEDNIMTEKVVKILKNYYETDCELFHLYHNRYKEFELKHENYKNNLNLMKFITKLNADQIIEWYKNIQIGRINKYNEGTESNENCS